MACFRLRREAAPTSIVLCHRSRNQAVQQAVRCPKLSLAISNLEVALRIWRDWTGQFVNIAHNNLCSNRRLFLGSLPWPAAGSVTGCSIGSWSSGPLIAGVPKRINRTGKLSGHLAQFTLTAHRDLIPEAIDDTTQYANEQSRRVIASADAGERADHAPFQIDEAG